MKQSTTPRLMLALSLRVAESVALVDWKWTRYKPSGYFLNQDGEPVKYISESRHVYPFRDGVLYLGYGWWLHRDADLIIKLCEYRGFVISDNANGTPRVDRVV